MCLRRWLQVLHGVEQAALQDPGAAALPHDPDAALLVQLAHRAAALVVSTGLTQSPAPLRLILNLLGLDDGIAAGLRQGGGRRCCGIGEETRNKFRQEASAEDARTLQAGSDVEHTAGAGQLSAVLEQTGHAAATAGLGSAPVRRRSVQSGQGTGHGGLQNHSAAVRKSCR